jgi:hypothetical protein
MSPDPGGVQADFRAAAGEQDTDDNIHDFVLAAAAPRNSASTPIDKVGPITTVSLHGVFQLATSIPVSWSATDQSGVAQYQSRARTASPTVGFGGATSWYTGTATSSGYSAAAGQTACFSTRAQDTLDHWGALSAEKCTAVPIDDRGLFAKSFSRQTATGYFLGTYSLSTVAGAKLSSTTITAKRLALLATTCATCGKVQVKWKGVSLGTFNLHSATTKHEVLIPLKTLPAVQTGVLQITTVSAARVEIDGVGASRT